uniref:Metalloendopeptidase n=1 Tax=Strongyloides stercoralis TaxID=6248 RepID=A0AAF5D299_STRER
MPQQNFIFLQYVPKIHYKDNKKLFVYDDVRIHNWPPVIGYYVDNLLKKERVEEALNLIQQKTCFKFKEYKVIVPGRKGLNFLKNFKCDYVSFERDFRKYYENNVYLSPFCQDKIGAIQQMTMKVIGFYDIHNRPDRDNYIDVIYSNIEKKYLKYFDKIYPFVPLAETAFDFGSALHYNVDIYSNKYKPIIVSKIDYYYNMLGQQKELSFNDYKLINTYYCSDNCINETNFCLNSGYLNPHNCTQCICPPNFIGERCEEIEKSEDEECGDIHLWADDVEKQLIILRDYICNYYIKSKPNTKIKIILEEIDTVEYKPCNSDVGFQIKYIKDKGSTGLCLCGKYNNITLISEDNTVFIQYVGWTFNDKVVVKYQEISEV